jgi:hypothetical protein
MLLALTAALWGCCSARSGAGDDAGDTDHDGVPDAQEAGFGMTVGEADTDHDGLDDGAELEAGTHPQVADYDQDALTDGQEVLEIGTDPWDPDSDGDGDDDGEEVAYGTDPLDAEEFVYAGGWPFQPDKDRFGAPEIGDADTEPGDAFARLKLLDQYGEQVDLYDFAGHGKPTLVVIHAVWCPPSNGVGEWISGVGDSYGYDGYWPNVRGAVDRGEMFLVHVIGENRSGQDPTLEDVQAWAEKYPHDLVPVLAGNGDVVSVYINYAWPSFYFLDENLRILAGSDGTDAGHWAGLEAADAYHP